MSRLFVALAFMLFLVPAALGTATVATLANATVSADNAGGAYVSITGPVLNEGQGRDIGTGTIVLSAPDGFAFDPTATVTVTVTRQGGSGNALTLASPNAVVSASSITVTVTATDTTGSTKSRLSWSGIRVRATVGTPLASGNIRNMGTASISGLNSSSNFGTLSETGGAVVGMAFSRQPGGALAGAPFGTQPMVIAQDQFGNASSNGLPSSLNVTLSLTSGTGPLQGTTTLNIGTSGGRGTAAFTNLRIDAAGTGKQLTATPAGGFSSFTSDVFSVLPGPASRLVFGTPPSSTATAGVAFAQQPVIRIEDGFNNLRTTDTLTVFATRSAGAGVLLGTTNVAAVAGIATFANLAHPMATNITISFTAGSLTPAVSGTITISPGTLVRLQVLVPGEAAAPGTANGKTGAPFAQPQGLPFSVAVNGVDSFWNITPTSDLIHLTCSDPSAVLPPNTPLNNGRLSLNVTANTPGPQTLTGSDLSNGSILSGTSGSFVVATPGPVLPPQSDQIIDELTALIVNNTATDFVFSTNSSGGLITNTFIFNYANRSALLADGWSFVATNPDGSPRNTEITNAALGAVADYNQAAHPGSLQIPCDLGDLWGSANSSRNSLFRSLPASWTSVQVAIGLAPRTDFQQAHLMLYQDDDNYIQSGVAFNTSLGGEIATLVWELGGGTDHLVTQISLINSIRLRLDRDLASGTLTGYYSLNGSTWFSLGSQNVALNNPRLGFWVGGSQVAWSNGLPVCSLQRLDVISTNTPVPILNYQLIDPPAGAAINGNGIITWTPSEPQGPATNIFTTIVTDSLQLSATNSFSVVVREINTAPVLPSQGNRVSLGQALVIVTNTAIDSDLPANQLTYELTGPANAAIDSNGIITWTPTPGLIPSTNTFVTVVTDFNPVASNSQHLSATNSFVVFVSDQALTSGPSLPAQTDEAINELSVLLVTNTATGSIYAAQVQTNSYTFNYSSRSSLLSAGWSFVATAPDGTPRNTEITNSAAGAVASYNQTAHPGTLWIPCDVGDLWSSFNNTRNSLFRPLPAGWTRAQLSLSFAPSLAIQQAHLVLYQDDDNYVAAGLAFNGGLVTALDQETGGSPATLHTASVAGTNMQLRLDRNPISGDITALYSSDGVSWAALGQASQSLVNPRLAIWVGGSPYPFTNGMANCILRRVDIVSSNNVPSVLTYHLVNPPVGAAIDGNGIISWTPTETQGPGTNLITTIVNDNGVPPLSATNSFNVVVNEINRVPLLPALLDQTINGLATLLVTNTASDLDLPANSLGYQLVVAPPTATINSTGVITWTTALADVPSTNLFVTVVTDTNPWAINSQHLSATNSFQVFVNAIHNGPVLLQQSNRVAAELTAIIVTNTAIYSDVPPYPLIYALQQPPPGASIDSDGIITWTPSEAQGPGTNLITTVVSDTGVPPLSATNTFVVVVNEVNSPPALPSQSDLTIDPAVLLVITNTAFDSDVPANALTYQLQVSPSDAVIDAAGVISWTAPSFTTPTTNLFVTVVTDSNPWAINSQQLSSTNSFIVTVNADTNTAPPSLSIDYNSGDNTVVLFFEGSPLASYEIQWQSSVDGSWNVLATVQADSDGQVQYQTAGPAETAFFRVRRL